MNVSVTSGNRDSSPAMARRAGADDPAAAGSTRRRSTSSRLGCRAGWRSVIESPRMAGSVSALPGEHNRDGAGENQAVEPQRPAVDVHQIELNPLLVGAPTAAADLPQAGDARLRGEAAHLVATGELREVALQDRPRSDDAHVAAQDVDELGQLIHAREPQPTPQGSRAGIVLDLEERAIAALGGELGFGALRSVVHRAELQHRKEGRP